MRRLCVYCIPPRAAECSPPANTPRRHCFRASHLVSRLPLGKASSPGHPCSRQRGALMALQVIANNDAPGSDGILAECTPGGLPYSGACNCHLWSHDLRRRRQRCQFLRRSSPTVQFSSPERFAASFLEYLSPKQTRHKLGNACPWRLHQVPCNACFG